MKKVYLILIVALVVMVSSCGEGDGKNIKPADPPIVYTQYKILQPEYTEDVPLNGCFEVQNVHVRRDQNDKERINITIDVKKVKELPLRVDYVDNPTIQLLDEEGAVLQEVEMFVKGHEEVCKMPVGSVGTITGDTQFENLSQIKFVRLSGFAAGHKKERETNTIDYDDSSSDESESVSINSSSYENIVNDQMKKAEDIANRQMQEAERIANQQMEEAERIANEQMEKAQEQARKAMGL